MIAQRFAVIAREDDHGGGELACPFQLRQDACELIVDLRDHGVVIRLDPIGIMLIRRTHFILKIDAGQFFLLGEVRRAKMGPRHLGRTESIGVDLGRDKGRVGIVDVDIEQPRRFAAASLFDKLQRTFACPSRLMQSRGYVVVALSQRIQIAAALPHPLRIVVTLRPIITRRVTESPVRKPVINPRFGSPPRTLKVEFPDQSTIVS